jgi:hypothetical protein
MALNLTSPVTGGPQTNFTTPTYTLVVDTAPDVYSKQWAVSALGGTQTGVTLSSVASPFTITVRRPKSFQVLGKPHPVTGLVPKVGFNGYGILTRKGVTPLTGQPFAISSAATNYNCAAGSDTADPANLRAMVSLHVGSNYQLSSGIGDTCISGII